MFFPSWQKPTLNDSLSLIQIFSDDSEEGEEDVSDGDEDVENEKPKMGVQVGKAEVQPSKEEQEKALNEEQFRLREMMIKKKHKVCSFHPPMFVLFCAQLWAGLPYHMVFSLNTFEFSNHLANVAKVKKLESSQTKIWN